MLIAELTIRRGLQAGVERTMSAAVPKVREEPGNHAYLFNRLRDDPRTFIFYEQYADRPAFPGRPKPAPEGTPGDPGRTRGNPGLRGYPQTPA